MRIGVLVGGVSLALAVGGCGETEVEWDNYAPEVRQRIQAAIADRDCRTLQAEFDTAYEVQDTAELVNYLNDAMEDAGCYAD